MRRREAGGSIRIHAVSRQDGPDRAARATPQLGRCRDRGLLRPGHRDTGAPLGGSAGLLLPPAAPAGRDSARSRPVPPGPLGDPSPDSVPAVPTAPGSPKPHGPAPPPPQVLVRRPPPPRALHGEGERPSSVGCPRAGTANTPLEGAMASVSSPSRGHLRPRGRGRIWPQHLPWLPSRERDV